LYPLAVAALVFAAACRTRPIGLHLDFSYGVYLLHGPVIQIALLLGIFSDSVEGFVISAIIILLLAMGAEATIERPFIALGRRLSRGVRTTPVLSAANG
jgi:peptidoglycan/LPS O-acetylase OafA/YrhL